MPIVSYSADLAAAVAQRSRKIGFTSHLSAPLNPLEVAHQIAVAAPADLATRWQRSRASLLRYLNRVDPLIEMVQHVAASLEPGPVAEALVCRAAAWLPAPSWAVVGPDTAGGTDVTVHLAAAGRTGRGGLRRWRPRTAVWA